jgi:hypothetical protein
MDTESSWNCRTAARAVPVTSNWYGGVTLVVPVAPLLALRNLPPIPIVEGRMVDVVMLEQVNVEQIELVVLRLDALMVVPVNVENDTVFVLAVRIVIDDVVNVD